MSALSSWQKIDRVLLGQPFGDGKDGAYSSATIPTLVYKACTGTASSTTLTADTDSSPFAVGDVLLIFQSRGSGVGQWEINRVSSVGSDTYTLQQALQYTYVSPAQAIKVPRYTSVTCSGTWDITSWNEEVGGILVFAANGTATITGTVDGDGDGFRNDGARGEVSQSGQQGEGTSGAGTVSTSANGNGGGGGQGGNSSGYGCGGGGGGNASAGSSGSTGGSPLTAGTGGTADGSADLVNFVLGGEAGGGGADSTGVGGVGGNGGAGVFIFAKNIAEITGGITLDGSNGGNSAVSGAGAGGGGAGGSCLIVCQTATIGTTKIGVAAGVTGGIGHQGGTGSVGRIAVHHSSTVTGTTSPSFTDVSDASLRESASMGYMI